MKHILLLCCEGMSTGIIVQKMKQEIAAQGLDYDVLAESMTREDQHVPGSDIVMIGPQVRYITKKLQQKYPDKLIVDIPMQLYGLMDGKKMLDLAMTQMGDK